MFTRLEGAKERLGIEDYSVSQTTLEQIFLKKVHESEAMGQEDEGAAKGLYSLVLPVPGTTKGAWKHATQPLQRACAERENKEKGKREEERK